MMSTVLIAALSPWCGSRRNLAPTIAESWAHTPAIGSRSAAAWRCSSARPPARWKRSMTCTAISSIWAASSRTRSSAPQLYRRARRVLGARQFSDEAAARFREHGDIPASGHPPGARLRLPAVLLDGPQRRGRHVELFQGFSRRFTVNGGHSGKRWASVVQSIPQWRRRNASGDDPIRGWDWTHRTDRGSSPRSDLLRPTLPGQRRKIRLRLRRGRPSDWRRPCGVSPRHRS